jgi:hypothetical protein
MQEVIKNKNLRSILVEINNKDANHIIAIKLLEKGGFDILKKENYTNLISNYLFIKK